MAGMYRYYEKPVKRNLPKINRNDLNAKSIIPGVYGHFTAQPNSNYLAQMHNYTYGNNVIGIADIHEENKAIDFKYKFIAKSNMKQEERKVHDQVKAKMEEYDRSITERRERLKELLEKEEKVYIKETIDNAQRGAENLHKDTMEAVAKCRAEKEAERKAFVEDMRIKQYQGRCDDYNDMQVQRHLFECKLANIQQMREKEARKEKDRELDKMWHEIMVKEMIALKEREEQSILDIKLREKENMQVLRKQMLGAAKLREEEHLLGLEDREEMQKLVERELEAELHGDNSACHKKEVFAREIREQLKQNRAMAEEKRRKEKLLDDLFARLNQAEVEKERGQIESVASQLHKERIMFLEYLVNVKKERAEQEKRIEAIADAEMQKVLDQQEADRCKVKLYWEGVSKEVMESRAKQIERNRKRVEDEKEQGKIEAEILRQIGETNHKLREEYERRKCEKCREYRQDLQKQLEYIQLLKKREDEEIERQLQIALEEDNRYIDLVHHIYETDMSSHEGTHPFMRLFNKRICTCPGNRERCEMHAKGA